MSSRKPVQDNANTKTLIPSRATKRVHHSYEAVNTIMDGSRA